MSIQNKNAIARAVSGEMNLMIGSVLEIMREICHRNLLVANVPLVSGWTLMSKPMNTKKRRTLYV